MSSFVYLIEAQIGVLKIGCAFSPESRLTSVRTHSPVPTRLIACWPGSYIDEQALHARFIAHRSHFEWFRIEGELLKFVAERMGQGLEAIEPWSAVLFDSSARRTASRARATSKMKAAWSDPALKLHWLGQLRFGKLEKKELGDVPYNRRTAEHHRISKIIARRAHEEARASEKGRQLIAQILLAGGSVPPLPLFCQDIGGNA
jgi:hypothetical protein